MAELSATLALILFGSFQFKALAEISITLIGIDLVYCLCLVAMVNTTPRLANLASELGPEI